MPIVCDATKVCNVTNVATVFSDMAGNVSANASVGVIDDRKPDGFVSNETDTQQPICVLIDSKTTVISIILLLLIILVFVPLKKHRN